MSAKKPAVVNSSVQIHSKFHGQLIGTGGAVAKKFQTDYNIRLNIPSRDSPSHIVGLSGTGDIAAAIAGLQKLLGFHVKEGEVIGTYKVGGIAGGKMGAIIGERGATLKKLEADSGCDITVPQRGAADSDLTVEGTPSGIAVVKAELAKLLPGVNMAWSGGAAAAGASTATAAPHNETKATSPSTPAAVVAAVAVTASASNGNQHKFYVPKRAQFEIIGPAGRVIKKLQEDCKVKIKMPKLEDPSTAVVVEGTAAAAESVRKEISKILGFEIGSTPLTTIHLAVNPAQYGLLIGPHGATVHSIERKTSCNVFIPRETEGASAPLVELEGTAAGVAAAKAEIESILRVQVKIAVPKADSKPRQLLHIDFSKPINEALFFPEKDAAEGTCFNRFLGFLASATRTLDICVFTITDGRITAVLRAAHKSGVKIRVITDNDTAADSGSDIQQLQEMKIEVKFDKTEFHMHHKFCVIDSHVVMTGSYNWTKSAATSNQENMVITNQPELVSDFKNHFEEMWADKARFSTDRIATRSPGAH